MIVIVGFQARIRTGSLKWLKKGYRHCFAYQQVDDGWVLCDPMRDSLLLRSAPAVPTRALLTAVAAIEASAVAIQCEARGTCMPWLRPITCVEVCKRVAGRQCGWLITPYQLFRHLALKRAQREYP
jgi:hypothetical protein